MPDERDVAQAKKAIEQNEKEGTRSAGGKENAAGTRR
jgi:hypothetical protein